MKKLTIILCLVSLIISSQAQTNKPGTAFDIEIKGGLTLPKVYSDQDLPPSVNPSFFIGSTFTFPLSKRFFFQPGVMFVGKGTQYFTPTVQFGTDAFQNYTQEYRFYYLEVPMNVLAHLPVGRCQLITGLGPYASFGLNGTIRDIFKSTGSTGVPDVDLERKYSFGPGGTDDLRFVDFGLNALAGISFRNGFNLSANYGLGLRNMVTNTTGITSYNKVVSIGVGYTFKVRLE